jgi:hypothetical protein
VTRGLRVDAVIWEGEACAHSVLPSRPRRVFVDCHVPMTLRVVGWVGGLDVADGSGGGGGGEIMYLLYTDFDTSGNFVIRDSVD